MNECLINQSFVTFWEAESTLYLEVPTEGWMLPLREPKEGPAYWIESEGRAKVPRILSDPCGGCG